jgi:hypothetical protein
VSDDPRADEIRRLEALVEGATGALAFPALAEAHRRAGRPETAERVARQGLERAPHVAAGRIALALALIDQKRAPEASAELERLIGADDAEHAIARDAAATDAPEGVAERTPVERVVGELATLEPYADTSIPPRSERREPADETPSVPMEPAAAGPFGPPPPPAPAEPLVFDAEGPGDEELDSAFEAAESETEQMVGADDVARAALDAVPEEEDGDDELDPMARARVADGEDDLATRPGSPFATETVAGLLERQGHAEEAGRVREQIVSRPGATPAETSPEPIEVPDETPEPGEAAGPPEAAPPVAERGRDASAPETEAPTAGPPRKKNQATLERWLDNLRRDKR